MSEKPVYAVGLDAGSRKTRMVICVLENGRLRLAGAAAVESEGWHKARIADHQGVAETVLAALRGAEACSGASVESAVAGIGGPGIRGHSTRGHMEMDYVREIDQRDVNRVLDRAMRVQLQEDRMILQVFPQDFVVDDHPGHHDPRKMMASHLELNVHVVTSSVQEHKSLVGAINQAHLMVEETVFEGLAACYAAVRAEDRREGIAVIDIGAHSTELVAYYGDAMYIAAAIPICGDHFTRDLAQGLCISFDDAELVKLEFGSALSSSCGENIFVELPTLENREPRHTTAKLVNEIIEWRARELFQLVRAELARVNMERALIGGVFLTGAGARLPGLCDLAERELMCQARYGLAIGIRDWPESMNDPEWSTAAGLAMYSATLKEQMAHQRETVGWIGKFLR
jgi:cell division protein FtsA